jgi:tetratricopeptide (TPR) repeat protein
MILLHDMFDVVEAYNRGLEYLDYNEPDQAIAAFSEAIRLNPKHAAAYFARGFALAEMGQLERALADYNRVIELQDDYAAAYLNRAGLHERLGALAEAEADRQHYRRLMMAGR